MWFRQREEGYGNCQEIGRGRNRRRTGGGGKQEVELIFASGSDWASVLLIRGCRVIKPRFRVKVLL